MSLKQVSDALLQGFADYMTLERNASTNTQLAYSSDVALFLRFLITSKNVQSGNKNACDELSGEELKQVLTGFNKEQIQEYISYRIAEGASSSSMSRFVASLKVFVRYLILENMREDDPLVGFERPKIAVHLPKVMSENMVMTFLGAPDVESPTGLRDRAMFELLYACGLRVSELCNLKFENLHLADGYIIIKGKGDKQRLIPVTTSAINWINRYVATVRKDSDPDLSCPYVFLSHHRKKDLGLVPLSRCSFWFRVKYYAKLIGMEDAPSPHTFRHAFATHLLNHSADLRSLQMLLGHSNLTTTQIYTHVATARMHEIYDKTHPLA